MTELCSEQVPGSHMKNYLCEKYAEVANLPCALEKFNRNKILTTDN